MNINGFNRVGRGLSEPSPFIGGPSANRDSDIFDRARTYAEGGPLDPGKLKPPDPTLGGPVSVGGSPISRDMQEAATIGAFGISGSIAGGAAGQALIPIPVVGAVIGSAVGSALGGLAGVAWNKLVN